MLKNYTFVLCIKVFRFLIDLGTRIILLSSCKSLMPLDSAQNQKIFINQQKKNDIKVNDKELRNIRMNNESLKRQSLC